METLKLRKISIDTYRENVAYLHRDCPVYRSEGFQALSKIEVHKADNGAPVIAVLNVVDDEAILAQDELGLSEQAFAQLNLSPGTAVRVEHARPPASLKAVHRKIAGERLMLDEYRGITLDIKGNRYSKIEIAAFLVSCSETGMERDEVLYLTRAMIETGCRQALHWRHPGQPHQHADRADRRRTRHAHPQDLQPRHHFAGGYSRYHGGAGARRIITGPSS